MEKCLTGSRVKLFKKQQKIILKKHRTFSKYGISALPGPPVVQGDLAGEYSHLIEMVRPNVILWKRGNVFASGVHKYYHHVLKPTHVVSTVTSNKKPRCAIQENHAENFRKQQFPKFFVSSTGNHPSWINLIPLGKTL